MLIETHPIEIFSPEGMRYLVIGSFPPKDFGKNPLYDWYYANPRNHFWSIIEQVYNTGLPNKDSRIKLFSQLKIGITDIIYKCERIRNSSLDEALKIIEFNPHLDRLLEMNLEAVFFTSRYVENHFRKNFSHLIIRYPKTRLVYLPSPSPRYAAMRKFEKIEIYRELLPSKSSLGRDL